MKTRLSPMAVGFNIVQGEWNRLEVFAMQRPYERLGLWPN